MLEHQFMCQYLSCANPKLPLWRVNDPGIYGRRLPTCASLGDTEVMEAVNVFDSLSVPFMPDA
jgi:hypothetical protein